MANEREYEFRVLAALKKAMAAALERKRRLGQYAVVWRDGRPQQVEPTAPEAFHSDSLPGRDGTSGAQETETDKSDRQAIPNDGRR